MKLDENGRAIRTTAPDNRGVVFAADPQGHRGSSAVVREVFATALEQLDPVAAQVARQDANWHRGYPAHVVSLVRASLSGGSQATIASARAGIASLGAQMRFVRDGVEYPLDRLADVPRGARLGQQTIRGDGDPAPRKLLIPYRDEMIGGDRLARQLDRWEQRGIIEPSHADAVRTVAANPDWLDLSDQTFVLLGASAEVGPLASLAGWRARIIAVDLPSERIWRRLEKTIGRGNASLVAPVRPEGTEAPGANLLEDLPELLDWLKPQRGPMTVGSYAYLDGARHVRVAAAMDSLVAGLAAVREDLCVAALATPSDVYAAPADAVRASQAAWSARSWTQRTWQAPVSLLSAGRFFRPNYPLLPPGESAALPGSDYGLCDCLVLQQGAAYALAKRLQQWRAIVSRADGIRTSINVTPSTTTRSVVRNRALEAAFGGARYFGVEAFDPATTSALMAALLVYDLRCEASPADPGRPLDHPLELLMHGANHGGMWRMPMAARSALPFAALIGFLRRSGP